MSWVDRNFDRRSRPAGNRKYSALLGVVLVLVGCSSPGGSGVSRATPADTVTSAISSMVATSSPAGSTTDATTGSSSACDLAPCYLPPVDLGFLDALAPEASGIAPSGTDPDLFFIVDDSAGTDRIIAIDGSGAARAIVTVTDLDAGNAEAISPGPCAETSQNCLYIGDIGDNGLRRDSVTVTRIAEPAVPGAAAGSVTVGPVPSEVWEMRYPDGPRNAESMLISEDGSVVIVTKPAGGATPHEIYRGSPNNAELVLVSSFTPPRALKPLQSILIGNVVTDASRLSDRVLLLTYDQAIEYLAPTPGADPAMFPDWPYRQLEIPGQWQSEGISYLGAAGLGACGFVVVSEKSGTNNAQLGRVDCAPA